GEAADFAGLVLLATLHDQVVGVAAGQNFLGVVGRGAQHAYGVVVRQQHIFDGFVADFADAANHVFSHDRRGLGVDHHNGLVTNDDARVGITLRRVGVGVVGQFFKGNDFVFQVVMRGEGLAHENDSTVDRDGVR